MKSIVFGYIDHEGDQQVTIGNYKYFESIKSTVSQIAWIFEIEHDGEWRYNFSDLSMSDQLILLLRLKDKNLLCYYPN